MSDLSRAMTSNIMQSIHPAPASYRSRETDQPGNRGHANPTQRNDQRQIEDDEAMAMAMASSIRSYEEEQQAAKRQRSDRHGEGSSSRAGIPIDVDEREPTNASTPTKKKALVVGIAAYSKGELRTPVKDAREMDKTLKQMGFESKCVVDCDFKTLRDEERTFISSLQETDVALFYFAGHGVEASVWQGTQNKQSNWLLAKKVPNYTDELPGNALDAQALLKKMEEKADAVVMILDCCRDNPLPDQARDRGLQGSGGLCTMNHKGSLISYACAPGECASDGGIEDHGLYTKHLLTEVKKEKGLEIEKVIKRVTKAVSKESKENPSDHPKGEQRPWYESSLTDDVILF